MNWVSIIFGVSVFGLVTTTILTLHGENLRLETQLSAEKAGRAADRAEYAIAAASAAEAAASAAQTYQANLEKVIDEQQEAANEEKKRADRAVADLAVANAVAQRLRVAAAKAAADPAVPPGGEAGVGAAPPGLGEAARSPSVVLADVFGRSDETSGILAAALDAAYAAGQQCQSDYHSLESQIGAQP